MRMLAHHGVPSGAARRICAKPSIGFYHSMAPGQRGPLTAHMWGPSTRPVLACARKVPGDRLSSPSSSKSGAAPHLGQANPAGAVEKRRLPRRTARALAKRDSIAASMSDNDILQLNVGGRSMLTARSTLLQVSGSVLHEMFCHQNQHLLTRSADGEVFLDFEPHMFGLVLRFMRELRMNGGTADASLSSFRAEDRSHLLLLLMHLRLLPPAERQKQAELQQAKQGTEKQQRNAPKRHAAAASEQQQQQRQQQQQQGMSKRRWRREAMQDASVEQTQSEHQSQRHTSSAKQAAHTHAGKKQLVMSPAASASARTAAAHGSSGSSDVAVPSSGRAASGMHDAAAARTLHQPSGSGFRSGPKMGGRQGPSPATPLVPRGCTSQSQLYFIQAQYEQWRGIKVSVYTESDLPNMSNTEPFDIFCDTTASDGQLTFTYVCRADFDNVFLGITTRNHTDRKGAQIPCFGWKSHGCIYSGAEEEQGGEALGHGEPQVTRGSSDADKLSHAHTSGQGPAARDGSGAPYAPLWGKGDSVELIVSLGDAVNEPCMVLKVNGIQREHISGLPPLRSSWSWYLALYMGGDMSAVTLMSDSYAVFWGDYQVKRFL